MIISDRENLPLISIIIATLNAEKTLEKCLVSIFNQNYSRLEVIIIDGGSTDETIKIIKEYQDSITYWESKPDKGVYHAWNKAICKAKGNYICFLGADDYFSSDNSIQLMVNAILENNFPDIVTAKVEFVDHEWNVLSKMGKAWNWTEMKKKMIVAHPGMLHRKQLFDKFGQFSEDYSIAGDYEFLLRLKGISFAFVDEVIVSMGIEGLSNISVNKVLLETYKIQTLHSEIGIIKAGIHYLFAIFKNIIKKVLTLTKIKRFWRY